MNLSPTARWLLGGLAAAVGAFGAILPTLSDVPTWVGVVVAVLGATFAALGIVPPQTGGTQQGVVNPSITEPPAADVAPRAGEAGLALLEAVVLLLVVAVVLLAVLVL